MSTDNEVKIAVVEEVVLDGQIAELVFIEEFAKRGEKPPHAKSYAIRIDKQIYHVHKPHPTGEELLHLAGKTSAGYKLYQIFRGRQPEPVAPHEHVDLRAHGIERFTTVPKDPKEGASSIEAPQRDFQLQESDCDFLDGLGLNWETIRDPVAGMLLVIDSWVVPAGYRSHRVRLALVLPPGYPDSQIDMAFFSPALERIDGNPIKNLSLVNWRLGQFQQWSRHRTPQNPWHVGVDDVSTHLSLVDDWLRREFEAR
jgi:hypothetical protein